jgi:hypothetical protein
MPLKQGSSDKVIQENIKCILDKNGCGYDPPYKDPSKEEYTPAQAAAIAYAKAGKRNNVGKKTSASKKAKGVEDRKLKTPGNGKAKPGKSQGKKEEKGKPGENIKVPDGWKVQEPGGKADTSKKNQEPESKPSAAPESKTPQAPPSSGKKPDTKVPDGWNVKQPSANPSSPPPQNSKTPTQQPPDKTDQSSSSNSFKASDQFGFKIPHPEPGFDVENEFENSPGRVVAQGAMGAVKFSDDGKVALKKGQIGQNEALAIKTLEKSGVAPRFLGAIIKGKGKTVSSGLGAHVKEAEGYIGMEKMMGKPAGAQMYSAKPPLRKAMAKEYLRVRKEIHTRGVAHNDMHGNNFFYDPDTGTGGLVDFGLAQVSYRAALVEALGTFNGRDWQADRVLSNLQGNLNIRELDAVKANIQSVQDDLDKMLGHSVYLEIRSDEEDFDDYLDISEEQAKEFIKRIYS